MTTIIFNDHVHANAWIAELELNIEKVVTTNDQSHERVLLSSRGEPLVKLDSFFKMLENNNFKLEAVHAIKGNGSKQHPDDFVQFVLTDSPGSKGDAKLWNALVELFGKDPVPYITATKSLAGQAVCLTITVLPKEPDKELDAVYLHYGNGDLFLSYHST
ncbi:hypothetical protein KKG46_04535 [Patescibacteria group bacterium]|nr:hypothetical protein [Patescibacteria group bacterium]